MKFRTEIQPSPMQPAIGYEDSLLALGSCFAERIGGKLAEHKFRIAINPTGTLFNPFTAAACIRRLAAGTPASRSELEHADGLWFGYDFDGSFSAPSPETALKRMNAALAAGREALEQARHLIVTFGTAWVYRLVDSERIVANCHKQPASRFERTLLGADRIVQEWMPLLEGVLRRKHVILTVSPVRHLGDGLEGNSLSKAILRVACAELSRRSGVDYFPAYECLIDDLRDYRFYDNDMVHPSTAAAEYIWEQFARAALSPEARQMLPRIESIVRAAAHRPLHPDSASWRAFCRKYLALIDSMPEVDFSKEKTHFRDSL